MMLALLLSTVNLALGNNSASAQQTQEKGPYVDQVTFVHREDENLALEEVKSGVLDEYYFQVPLEAASEAKNDARLTIYDRIAGSAGLLMNPAPAKGNDMLNPFQFREVRFAMNYLIDRQFVVNEILRDTAPP
jgi:peptide/nickel transport system substrate-binding protein